MKKLTILSILFLSLCGTPYHRLDKYGGYADAKSAFNESVVAFYSYGDTDKQTSNDLALLRAAELCIQKGFQFFVLMNVDNNALFSPKSLTGLKGNKGDGYFVRYRVKYFRNLPFSLNEYYYKAQDILAQISSIHKITLKVESEQKIPELETLLEIRPFPAAEPFLNLEHDEKVRFFEPAEALGDRSIYIGYYTDAENPYVSIEKFKEKIAEIASKKSVNAIKIFFRENDFQNAKDRNFQRIPHYANFLAQFYMMPRYHLGINLEPGRFRQNEYLVRGYYDESLSKSVLRGDKIVKINGIDVLDREKIIKDWFSWKKSTMIDLEIIRSGALIKVRIPVKDNT